MRQQLSDMETAGYGEDRKVDLTYMMNFDMSGSVEEKIACANAVREHLNEWQNDETNPQIMRLEYNVVSRAEGRIDYESSNGGLFFLGLFLGSMFLMITVLIIYYKQISEGYEDKERFAIMEKVGMSNAEVKASIRFRGREMAHMNRSILILDEFAESVSDIATVDKAPKVEGRSMTMFLTAKR